MMLTDQEIQVLYRDLESDRVERMESVQDTAGIAEAICAYANDLPRHGQSGVVFVGLTDNGSCADLEISDESLIRLAELSNDGRILPFPTLTVAKKTIDGCTVAIVEVQPSDHPPVRYNGRCWIRVGPRRAQATAEEERRLIEKRTWGMAPFDMHGVPNATIADLDITRFRFEHLPSVIPSEILAENDQPVEQQLQSLRLLTSDREPTVTSILAMGKNPRHWFPGAYIQFVRYDGNSSTDPIKDQKEIAGVLLDQLRQIEELLKLNIRVPVILVHGNRVEKPDYPLVALQQIARNAVMHRNYDSTHSPIRINWYNDKVEIFSPGSAYGIVSREKFGDPGITDYRNPTIAEVLKSLGYVDRFGRGIPLARTVLSKNHNPALEFDISDSFVLVTIRPAI